MEGKVNNNITLTGNEIIVDKTMKMLSTTDKNKIEATGDNFKNILLNDENLSKHFQYNLFTDTKEYIEYDEKGNVSNIRAWRDSDDSIFRNYIEKWYGIRSKDSYQDGFNEAMYEKSYHPIKDLLEAHEWDGKKRIDRFLIDILKCHEDEDYLREVSRMIFYGGISRIYSPGIKFDYMPVLSGKQGIGKSTIVQWLALNINYYHEVTTVDPKEGLECIRGGWICEFSELMAFHGRDTTEAIKSFITRQVDRVRMAYAHYTGEFPRSCIFIGTTNDTDYLSDETGNRRFLPLTMGLRPGELFAHEDEVKEYIFQCWEEARYLYNEKKTYLVIPSKYSDITTQYQNASMVEDVKEMAVKDYLDNLQVGSVVCTYTIACNVLGKIKKDVNKGDSKMIRKWMSNEDNWEEFTNPRHFDDFGRQRGWVKKSKSNRELRNESEGE